MLQKLGMEAAKVPELCHTLYKTYGTTMAGLRVQFNLINLRMNCLKTLFYVNRMIKELIILSPVFLPGNWL
jgi:hypothetical protein